MLHLTPFQLPDDSDAIARVVGSIIGSAIQSGAVEIHLQPSPEFGAGMLLLHRLRAGGELQEQMRLPAYIWPQMRVYLRQLAGVAGAFTIHLKDENYRISLIYRLEMSVQHDAEGETVILKLEQEFDPST